MKRLITFLNLICIVIILIMPNVSAKENTYTLEMKVINNDSEDVEIYILLPKEYILYAIDQDNLNIEYEGTDTLIKNNIPSINVNKKSIQSQVYEGNDEEYIQILLKKDRKGIYQFDILTDYNNMDMKYRVQNKDKDYIMHIDKFKVDDGKCEIIYDYENETVKQPNQTILTPATKVLIFLLIIIITVGVIAYLKQRRY